MPVPRGLIYLYGLDFSYFTHLIIPDLSGINVTDNQSVLQVLMPNIEYMGQKLINAVPAKITAATTNTQSHIPNVSIYI